MLICTWPVTGCCIALLLEPGGWLGWLHLPVAVFVGLYSWAWGDLPLLMMNGEMMSAT